jgi:hypothetical protein
VRSVGYISTEESTPAEAYTVKPDDKVSIPYPKLSYVVTVKEDDG